ncbi:MAG: heme NO-binding domain-containing protein [Roseibium sp.]|nr:heme NO-binding domain-containing protein [Roseibium sp.]
MKGIVFTEYLAFAEQLVGEDVVEDVIEDCDLPSGGAYTSVGTYDHSEIVTLTKAFSQHTGTEPEELVRMFGSYLGEVFQKKFGRFFDDAPTFFDFLANVHTHIHVEVQKLYPDAELPSIEMLERSEFDALLRYRSPRKMDSLALGLIQATAISFGENLNVTRSYGHDAAGDFVDFRLRLSG